jgi:hypothetical protein
MKEVKRILIGMNRPSRKEVEEMLAKKGIFSPYFWCRCFSFEISAQLGSFESHYLQGHYDEPVYKYVWEENERIIESLTKPNF